MHIKSLHQFRQHVLKLKLCMVFYHKNISMNCVHDLNVTIGKKETVDWNTRFVSLELPVVFIRCRQFGILSICLR